MDVIDARNVTDFQKFTFSGHLRTHVYKVLDENIKLGHADYACYWILELLCSGLVHSAWNSLFLSTAVHINRSAPNAFIYLVQMYEKFAPYEGQYSIINMTDIRNNSDVRNLFCEVSASLALCRKSKLPTIPKIKPEHDFLQIVLSENLKAPSQLYARQVIKTEDPMELFVPLNELCYSLEARDSSRALYWIAWILKFSSKYKEDHKTPLVCAYRSNDYVEEKYLRHVIWLCWSAIWNAIPKQGVLYQYVDCVYKMYCLRWSAGDLKKRLPFLTCAVLFICEQTTLDTQYSVPQNLTTVHQIIQNIPQWISAIVHTQKTFA